VTSSNTFTVIASQTQPLDQSKLSWTFQSSPAAPIANAGQDRTVAVGSLVTLDASGSTNPSGLGTLSYSWRFTSRPPGTDSILRFGTTATPTFVADVAGPYVIQLTVSNGTQSSTATVTITAI